MRIALVLWPLAAAVAFPGELEPLSSAEICGRCHRSILEAWKTSAHARAMESALFQDVLEMAEAEFGAGVRKECLGCHAPLAVHLGDWKLRQKISWEGVTCDYCHSVHEVWEAGPNPKVRAEFSLVKTGPIKDAAAPVHGTLFSAVHSSSRLCAPCHQYRNAAGLDVLNTYAEWKASDYARRGVECQSCHMFRVAGDVVDPRIRRSSLAKVNLHQMAGSHSIEQLNKTIRAKLASTREGNLLKLTAVVSNVAAGHYVPTGSPLRQLVLELRVDAYDGRRFQERRVYRRVVVDASGNEIDREYLAFLKGARVVADTRLAPGESRTETFAFPLPAGVQAQVTATLWYYYSPLARTESQRRITFRTISQLVR